ncbi:SoxS protein [Roseinatronobacter sp.]|uniref:SoxS protein n=1 Tax=Roseinatronobacter sp. TaxID=1945755 RepID=UPI0025EF8194|nr:SoxS protein [Rhodobaca sp.]
MMLSVFGGAAAQGQELRLLMVEQAGCYYCRVFNRDIAPVYEKTAEGLAAPLVHMELRGELPEGVTLASRPFVTPTFILIGPDGAEIERLTGFPGEDFFWPYISDMISTAQASLLQ